MVAQPIKDLDQIRKMRKELSQTVNGFRNVLIFEIGLASALRISDILRLQKKHFLDGIIRIKTKKTDVYKVIELNPRVSRIVNGYIENLEDEDYLFNVKYNQVYKIIKKCAEKVGIADISTHSLRKTAAWHFYHQSDRDLRKTMYLLGHKEPRETLAYLNLKDDEVNVILVEMDLH